MAMSEPTTSSLSGRLARLERENRRLKGAGLAVLLGLAAFLAMGHGEPAVKALEGDQIALRTAAGTIRGELSVRGDGGVALVLYDANRTPRVQLLSGPPDGAPALTLFDRRWAARATLRLDDDGTPQLALYDQAGKAIWKAP
jgi:hypothetical protein